MRVSTQSFERGNVLLCVLCTILVVSIIGGNVLLNCMTRYNAASSQVRSWKESLDAAETGGDIAYAEVRKSILNTAATCVGNPATCPLNGWTYSGSAYTNSAVTYGKDNLSTSARIDAFYYDSNGNPWYRIRTQGTAPVTGLKRVGMDDRMGLNTRGDSLLRKVDFNYDHFVATYGPNGDGLNKALVPVSQPQVTRRVELIAAPITPFEAAIKATGTFYGLGDAAMIDSYNSANGPYYFAANSPNDPHYSDSRSGNVEIASAVATIRGMLYGNVATNGGTIVRSNQITGTIDNNVPFTIPPFKMPTDFPTPQVSPNKVPGNSTVTINPGAAGSAKIPISYLFSSFTGHLVVKPYVDPNGAVWQTYVDVHVTSDVTGTIDVAPNVRTRIYFDGNVNVKARDVVNESGIASNLQFYGISPTDPSVSQSIAIGPPGNYAATFYAPSADFSLTGNPDITGAIVCKTFYGNGNTSWHYDRELDKEGDAVDYRVINYVEDVR
jgi:hypothetical protein